MQKVLIVGAGLSGICLTHHLIEQGVEVKLIDNGCNHSSKIAAGMINPLVFRRMTKSWRVDEFLPYARAYYSSLEEKWGVQIYFPITIRRFFSSEQERNFWLERQKNPSFSSYMHLLTEEDDQCFPYANNHGSGRVKQSAYIDTERFLNNAKAAFASQIDYRLTTFDYHELNAATGTYQGVAYDLIIFAEGYLGINNPWFSTLPLTQTKGETLTVQLKHLTTNESLNRKCFLLPLQEQLFKIGSNYSWDDATLHPTEEARAIILHNLTYLTDEVPEVVEHHAGVRPTTLDRRPFIGRHPDYSKLAIFNGLGAKGFLIAPLLVKEFVEHLLTGSPIDKECQIKHRFKPTN